jgi:hypothetical protein
MSMDRQKFREELLSSDPFQRLHDGVAVDEAARRYRCEGQDHCRCRHAARRGQVPALRTANGLRSTICIQDFPLAPLETAAFAYLVFA